MKNEKPTEEALKLARRHLAQLGRKAMGKKYSEAQQQEWRLRGGEAMRLKSLARMGGLAKGKKNKSK